MENRNHERKENGPRLRMISVAFTVAACVAAAALFLADHSVTEGYHQMEKASSQYVAARQAASDLEVGSDYLTDRVRCFVVTGGIEYLEDYFREAEVTRRRDDALDTLEILLEGSDSAAYKSLAEALEDSNELMEREYQAMALMLASGYYTSAALVKVPEAVKNTELTEEELAMTSAEQKQRAQELVFDDVYMAYKDKIRKNVTVCTEHLIESTSEVLEAASGRMDRLLSIQTGLTVLLLVIVLAIVAFVTLQVRIPLMHMVELMREQKVVPPAGAAELRFVTRTYNEILTENKAHQEKLAYDATHDPLTGLYNRGAYEMFMQTMDTSHIALMLVDVDKFKTVNDTYGHDIGDKILRRVAQTLKSRFRSVDIICRIGGDEFVVILTRVDSSMAQTVKTKILQANEFLMKEDQGLPPVSLSVGVAFADRENPRGDIFKDADTALYIVKEAGRCGCAVYGEHTGK